MIARRRFLTIAAAALAAPASGREAVWTGRALGAEVTIRLADTAPTAGPRLWRRIEAALERIEAQFSLYRDSALTRLNRDGRLAQPDPTVLALFRLAGAVHAATGGVFDPTIQPLWLATAQGGDLDAARALTGWGRVRLSETEIALDRGMGLTFNGIAQGEAADRLAALLSAEGYRDVLIDAGEIAALGRPAPGRDWTAAIAGPDGREIARTRLTDRALATSSPMGTVIGKGRPHILHPAGLAPRWSTVSVSAPMAAVADALSTAFCLMDKAAIHRALAAFPGARLEALA
jgi:FAD:protein FMN transferase